LPGKELQVTTLFKHLTAGQMNLTGNKDSAKIKKMVGWYNMIANLFWSALNLVPISVFCYSLMNLKLFYIFLVPILLTKLLPKSFFDSIQIGRTRAVYKKIGVHFINRFTQNGDIINRLIRKKFPQYKVIAISKVSVRKLLKQTYIFEKFHFAMFLFFTSTTIYALTQNYLKWALIISITNLVYNVYPIFLQQYIRVRLVSAGKRKT
jgi:Glycosyl-4,4'-diaponeurosporenoate acyltransferase